MLEGPLSPEAQQHGTPLPLPDSQSELTVLAERVVSPLLQHSTQVSEGTA